MTFDHAIDQLPDLDDHDLLPYRQGLAVGELRVQSCAENGHLQWPPRGACASCQSLALDWVAVPGTGLLHTWTTVWHTTLSDFRDRIPYAVGIVEIDAGPESIVRMVGYIDEEPGGLRVDEPLRVDFRVVADGIILPIWVR